MSYAHATGLVTVAWWWIFTYLPQVPMRYRGTDGCTAMLEGQLVINPGTRFCPRTRPPTILFTPKPERNQPLKIRDNCRATQSVFPHAVPGGSRA